MAADTRETIALGPNDSGPYKYDTVSKSESYENGVLTTINGTAKMFRELHSSGRVVRTEWDGGIEAARIASKLPLNPTEPEIYAALHDWIGTLAALIEQGAIHPRLPPPGKILVTLELYTRTSNTGFGVYLARFQNVDGHLAASSGRLRDPSSSEPTRFVPFGKCVDYFGSDADRSELTSAEFREYENLRHALNKAEGIRVLQRVVLDFERLAAKINARLASEQTPQDIAPPFEIETLAAEGKRWKYTRIMR